MPVYWQNDDRSWSDDSLRYIRTPRTIDRELFYYVQEIGRFKASPPYFTERENLPSFLMKYTFSGQGTLYYEGKTYRLEAGDVFLIDCMNYQHYYTSSQEPWQMDWIHFYGANSQNFYNYFVKNGEPVFKATNTRIPDLLANLLQQQTEQHVKSDFTTSLLIHELLNELIIQKNQLDFQNEDIPHYLTEMKAHLDSHSRETVTLDDLATKYCINKYQLNKEFSRFIGLPPIDYHITNKISFAKELLRYSSTPIKAIALEVGIDNFSYFSRLFKKKTGMSPSDYRKNG